MLKRFEHEQHKRHDKRDSLAIINIFNNLLHWNFYFKEVRLLYILFFNIFVMANLKEKWKKIHTLCYFGWHHYTNQLLQTSLLHDQELSMSPVQNHVKFYQKKYVHSNLLNKTLAYIYNSDIKLSKSSSPLSTTSSTFLKIKHGDCQSAI